MSRARHGFPLFLLLGALLAAESYGNGINPPRQSGSKTVVATCTDRATGEATTIQRTRIFIAEPSGSLELRIGKSAASTLQLSKVIRVQIPSAKTMSDGFAKASLELLDPGYEGPGFVRLEVNTTPVRLTGFSADLRRVDVPLATCKELTLQTSESTNAKHGEGALK
jgi:hypothetical protein